MASPVLDMRSDREQDAASSAPERLLRVVGPVGPCLADIMEDIASARTMIGRVRSDKVILDESTIIGSESEHFVEPQLPVIKGLEGAFRSVGIDLVDNVLAFISGRGADSAGRDALGNVETILCHVLTSLANYTHIKIPGDNTQDHFNEYVQNLMRLLSRLCIIEMFRRGETGTNVRKELDRASRGMGALGENNTVAIGSRLTRAMLLVVAAKPDTSTARKIRGLRQSLQPVQSASRNSLARKIRGLRQALEPKPKPNPVAINRSQQVGNMLESGIVQIVISGLAEDLPALRGAAEYSKSMKGDGLQQCLTALVMEMRRINAHDTVSDDAATQIEDDILCPIICPEIVSEIRRLEVMISDGTMNGAYSGITGQRELALVEEHMSDLRAQISQQKDAIPRRMALLKQDTGPRSDEEIMRLQASLDALDEALNVARANDDRELSSALLRRLNGTAEYISQFQAHLERQREELIRLEDAQTAVAARIRGTECAHFENEAKSAVDELTRKLACGIAASYDKRARSCMTTGSKNQSLDLTHQSEERSFLAVPEENLLDEQSTVPGSNNGHEVTGLSARIGGFIATVRKFLSRELGIGNCEINQPGVKK